MPRPRLASGWHAGVCTFRWEMRHVAVHPRLIEKPPLDVRDATRGRANVGSAPIGKARANKR
jgi:hypothetical protein